MTSAGLSFCCSTSFQYRWAQSVGTTSVSKVFISSSERSIFDAVAFSLRCDTEDVPGMAMMTGDLLKSQAKAMPAGVTPSLVAIAFNFSDSASFPILSG
jgi:hypothetical protein